MRDFLLILFVFIILVTGCSNKTDNSLKGKVICIDPGHGGTAETDSFRVGPTGEREEWINLRVALKLAEMLKNDGAVVILTRSEDESVALRARAELAINKEADVFVSIHHNATADSTVNFPIIYFHGNVSENGASIILGKSLAKYLRTELYRSETPVSLVSDLVIFPSGGTAVLRHSYGIPGIIGEASFFTNRKEEVRLKNDEYNLREARAYYLALKEFFSEPVPEILSVYSKIKLPPFRVLQEADRMNPIALQWEEDFHTGKNLADSSDPDSLEKGYYLLTRSVRSFPDSWLARDAHIKRSEILYKLGRTTEADTAMMRAEEFFAPVN